MKRLYLLRHAKSSWEDGSLADHDRPLAPRGERAARAMGRHLAQSGTAPDEVLCSSARRALETLARLRAALDPEPRVRTERAVYQATSEKLLARIRAVDDIVESLLVIGHEPTISELACELAAPDASKAWLRMGRKFPTAACAEIHFDVERWRDLAPPRGELRRFIRPKDLV